MASLKFILQTKKNPSNIYIRLMLSKDKDIKRKTGLLIDPKEWNHRAGMPKHPGDTYMKLTELSKKVWEGLNSVNEPTGDWLEGVMSGPSGMLSETIKDYIANAPDLPNAKGGKGLSANRIKNLKTFAKLISKYKDVPISKVGKGYIKGLSEWMKDYSNNYVTKTIENLRAVLRYAQRKGIAIDPGAFAEKTYWEHNTPVILTLDELERIKTLELDEKLSNVRKWLLLGCYTGQRVGDLFSLKETDIKTVKGKKFIELKQQKTFNRVVIPLIPDALEIIKGGFPRYISQQKFNVYLKELMGKAEIDKNITSHCMRRSFASNYYGTMPTPLIMQITGHKKESSFLTYIGKSEYDMAFEFLEHYGKK